MRQRILSKGKIEDVRLLAQEQNIDIIGISEIDLNSSKYSSEEIEDKFHIDEYKIFLPTSWETNGVARVMVYVKNNVPVEKIEDNVANVDLQHVLLNIGKGKTKHCINVYYREWKSCVTQQNSNSYHIDYFTRLKTFGDNT